MCAKIKLINSVMWFVEVEYCGSGNALKQKWIMRVKVQTVKMLEYIYLCRKLVIAYVYAEKYGICIV